MKKIFVTGFDGFLGSKICPRLEDEGYEVSVLPFGYDIRDTSVVREFLPKDTEVILHLAALVGGEADAVWSVNALGTFALLEAARFQCPKLEGVFAFGSAAEYGSRSEPWNEGDVCEPLNTYGKSKLFATKMLLSIAEQLGITALIFRPFNIMGIDPLKTTLPRTLAETCAMQDSPVQLSLVGLDYVRDWIAVEDVVDSVVRLLQFRGSPQVVNIAGGRGYTNREVAEAFAKIWGKEIVLSEKEIPENARQQVIPTSIADVGRLHALLPDWNPLFPDIENMVGQVKGTYYQKL